LLDIVVENPLAAKTLKFVGYLNKPFVVEAGKAKAKADFRAEFEAIAEAREYWQANRQLVRTSPHLKDKAGADIFRTN
jgi:hypothetical protein